MAGRVVPASPRLVMSLADHLGGGQALPALRRQALTYDDRQATNWLLKGEAKVVVLPLQPLHRSVGAGSPSSGDVACLRRPLALDCSAQAGGQS